MAAAAAPSSITCWVVGRSGQIFLTVDGSTWTHVAFPEAVDLASVTATDARTATVTTVDRRQFDTRDGGGVWTARQ
jgi:photosystem II stability/assembly factor-like uncharacterized protein